MTRGDNLKPRRELFEFARHFSNRASKSHSATVGGDAHGTGAGAALDAFHPSPPDELEVTIRRIVPGRR